jgi:hypothetical protein
MPRYGSSSQRIYQQSPDPAWNPSRRRRWTRRSGAHSHVATGPGPYCSSQILEHCLRQFQAGDASPIAMVLHTPSLFKVQGL